MELAKTENPLREAAQLSLVALRQNLLPGIVLQMLMVLFFCAYVWHEGTQQFLAQIADFKRQAGLLFAFCSYFFAGGLLPELLRVVFFQKLRIHWSNIQRLLIAGPFWGTMGMVFDRFYLVQLAMFGAGNDFATVLKKVLFDQFVFGPFFGVPVMLSYFYFWERGANWGVLGEVWRVEFFLRRALPVMVAGWFIWIPGVTLVYNMPLLLQIPVAVSIHAFWVLVFTTLSEASARKQARLGGGEQPA